MFIPNRKKKTEDITWKIIMKLSKNERFKLKIQSDQVGWNRRIHQLHLRGSTPSISVLVMPLNNLMARLH